MTELTLKVLNLLAADSQPKILNIIGIVGGVLGVICGISCIVYCFVSASKHKVKKTDEAPINADADTMTEEQAYLEKNEQGYMVMSRNVIYSVGLNGQLSDGDYSVKSADGAGAKFNMRVNGLVREYADSDEITLTDGDTVSPVSGSVIIARLGE